MTTVLGIDEAGRGPVLGPMVICGALFAEEDTKALRKLKVRDSKLLSPARREELDAGIRKIAKRIIIVEIPADKIDEYRAQGVNLNQTEAIKIAEIIKVSAADKAYVDAPQQSAGKFRQLLLKLAQNHTEIVAENYADRTYPVVSAASIVAKVLRDRRIEELKEEYGCDFGVGYSHDARTIAFLKEWLETHDDYPPIVRKSWSTAEEIKLRSKQKGLDSFLAAHAEEKDDEE